MILLHRLTPIAVAFLTLGGYLWVFYAGASALVPALVIFALIVFSLIRLLKWEWRSFSFWVFFGVPIFFFLSSFLFYVFLESDLIKALLVVSVAAGMWLYSENLFTFYYLPGSYQAYALEYLTLVLYVVSAFFFTSAAFAAQLFLQLPLWAPALAVFIVILMATIAVFWVSKVPSNTSLLFAVSGAIIMTELYVVISFFPTSFLTNAALFSIFLYLYLGLSRAHVLEKLTQTVIRRYVGIAGILLIFVILSAQWI